MTLAPIINILLLPWVVNLYFILMMAALYRRATIEGKNNALRI